MTVQEEQHRNYCISQLRSLIQQLNTISQNAESCMNGINISGLRSAVANAKADLSSAIANLNQLE